MKKYFEVKVIFKNEKREPLEFQDVKGYQFVASAPFFYIEYKRTLFADDITKQDYGSFEIEQTWIPNEDIKTIEGKNIIKFESPKEKEDFLANEYKS